MKALAVVLILSMCSSVHAQELQLPAVPDVTLPDNEEIIALEQNERAPHAGMLIADADLVGWRQLIERLQYRIDADRALFAGLMASRLAQEVARTHAAEERFGVHEQMWSDKATELATQLANLREETRPSIWTHPVLWFGIGVLVTVVTVAAVALSLR